ncbi:hypothetical protein KL928_001959 [Ogataea angusta]|uniref:Family 17 glucosidase SCW11 n=1 Tax=Pichia angusta TaxID=870730 RepID=A0AAN6I6G5_PICAN|nr:uncharacterized protein KL928_001959 [Ogataea angusta]KAG7820522.1 hypothetical protein KL928_001959 [Ogataea angusta]
MRVSVALLTVLAAVQAAPVPLAKVVTRMHTADAVTTTQDNYYTVTSTIPIVEILISNGVTYTNTLLTIASGSDIDAVQPTTTVVAKEPTAAASQTSDSVAVETQTSNPVPTDTSISSTSTSSSQDSSVSVSSTSESSSGSPTAATTAATTTATTAATSEATTEASSTTSSEDFDLVGSVNVENTSTSTSETSSTSSTSSSSSVTTTEASSTASPSSTAEPSSSTEASSSTTAASTSSETSSTEQTSSSTEQTTSSTEAPSSTIESSSTTTSSSSSSSSSSLTTSSTTSSSSSESSSSTASSTTSSVSSTSSSSAASTVTPSAIVYSPYTDSGSCKDYDTVESDLSLIQSKGIGEVRIYGNDCNYLTTVLPICANKGIKVDQGFYISSSGVDSIDDAVTELIAAVQDSSSGFDWDLFSFFSVGNEVISNGYATVSDLISKISSVKSQLQSGGYTGKVTTAEPPSSYQSYPELCTSSGIDFVGINAHAYFDQYISAADAGTFLTDQVKVTQEACPNMDVKVVETGYPSQGKQNGGNIPSPENQKTAIKKILEDFGSDVTILTTYNDFWKDPGPYGIEQYFGVIDILE